MNPEKPKFLTIQRKDDFILWLESRMVESRFFRRSEFLNHLPVLMTFMAIAVTGIEGANFVFSNSFIGDFKPLVGAMSYALGAIVDEESTIRAFYAVTGFEKRTGINSGFVEAFPFRKIPERPNEDFFNSFRVRILNSAVTILSILQPQYGVAIGVGKLYAGWHNERVRALHERKLNEFIEIQRHPNYYL